MSNSKVTRQLERVEVLLDSSIPLGRTGYRIGLDPIIGLIPGIGDALSALISSYIIIQAARLGASHLTLFRMMLNVLFDTIVGCVPIAGDLFDFAFKANQRNLQLIKNARLIDGQDPRKKLVAAMFSTLAVALAFCAAIVGLLLFLLLKLIRALMSSP